MQVALAGQVLLLEIVLLLEKLQKLRLCSCCCSEGMTGWRMQASGQHQMGCSMQIAVRSLSLAAVTAAKQICQIPLQRATAILVTVLLLLPTATSIVRRPAAQPTLLGKAQRPLRLEVGSAKAVQ
jgi:hypothetical protein